MGVDSKKRRAIWISWALFVPLGLWLAYLYYPPQFSEMGMDLIGFMTLALIGAVMPMVINNTPISVVEWALVAVFLQFGLFIEMVVAQIAITILLIRLRVGKSTSFRYPLNSLMFFAISLISGMVYLGLGGDFGIELIDHPKYLLIAIIYSIVHFLVNQVFITVNHIYIYNRERKFFGKDFMWDMYTAIISLPIGYILYILYKEVGFISFLFVGVPFVSVSIILYLYYSSQKINEYLHAAAEIGHQLAERLNVDEVLDLFIQKISEMLPVDYAYILDVAGDELKLLRRVEGGEIMPVNIPSLKRNEGISGMVWASRKAALFHTAKEWSDIAKGYMPPNVHSVLCVPIVRHHEAVGVLMLASKRKRAYEKSQLIIVDLLCSHFAVAIENAKHYKATKENSETCALTKLYNYRYFERLLTEEYNKMLVNQREVLSLIILDLDHFKVINDTYGHQSGNEILCELANRLKIRVGNKGTVARYGGEEFVILLPDIAKEEALEIAEWIRQDIAYYPFILEEHIGDEPIKLSIHVTASIGVATAPVDADDPLALIRHADRALYVGAKRAGRNRVAEYVK
ncbi:sensor domain-containing diguanylate cyclase [Neobacillus sp. D3-1R]|uniref:sensor domain-containing diguanylate cyclase n=1 Tax=Neobacillus sp. D3-1R TaxID=3445778 RepID=UPI003FA12B1D